MCIRDSDSDDSTSDLKVRGVGTGAEGSSLPNKNVGSAISGTYGTFTLNQDGSYSYDVTGNAATIALTAGATATDTFSYKVRDDETNAGSKAIDIGTITFTVTGINETVTATDDNITLSTTDGSTTVSATVNAWDSDRGLMEVSSPTGVFDTRVTLTGGTSTETGTIRVVDTSTASTTVGTVVDTDGVFLNEDGHVSESTMKVQDSLYYQDFSYVIKVGRAIVDWRKAFKDTIHPTGFYVTGQVNVETSLNASMSSPVEGVVSGVSHAGLALIINTLFSTILGRRLGTVDDGTTLRSNSHIGVGVDLDDSTSEHFTANTRDETLKGQHTIKAQVKDRYDLSHRSATNLINGAVVGHRFRNLNRHAFMFSGGAIPQTGAVGNDSTERKYIQEMTIGEMSTMLSTIGVQGTKNTSIDGEGIVFGDIENDFLRTNIAFPTEIRINYN